MLQQIALIYKLNNGVVARTLDGLSDEEVWHSPPGGGYPIGWILGHLAEYRTAMLAILGSPRLAHVLVQSEIETFAIEADGTVGWRIAHSDVVSDAALVGGRLVLTSYTGQVSAVDPATGRSVAS